MHSSEISYDRNSRRTRSYENGLGVEFLLFVDQFHGSPTRSLFLSLSLSLPLHPIFVRIFIARFRCIAQNADKSHYPGTTVALKRAAYLAALKFRSKPFSEPGEEKRQRWTDENHRRPLSWMRYSVRSGGRDGSILMSLLNFNDVGIPSTAAHVILRS